MARYIDMNELLHAIDKRNGRLPLWLDEILMVDCKVADVAPVVHGRWVYNPNGMDWNLGAWQCSVCKCNNNNLPGNDKHNPYIFQGSNYCPNCGAKMDGDGNG